MKKIVLLFSVAAVFALVSIAQAAGSMPEIKYDDRIKECGCPPCCPKDVRAGSLPQIDVDKRIEDCGCPPSCEEKVARPQPAPAPAPQPEPVVKKKPEPVVEKAPAAVPAKEKVTITLNVEFDTNKTTVNEKYYDDIKRVADFMKANPDTTAAIEGHTDNVGNDAFNKALSEKRAKNVRQYIIDKFGIDEKRITAAGFGEEVPIAGNDTAEGRQKNRRVEAVLETK